MRVFQTKRRACRKVTQRNKSLFNLGKFNITLAGYWKETGRKSCSDRRSDWRGEQGANRKILAWPSVGIWFYLERNSSEQSKPR